MSGVLPALVHPAFAPYRRWLAAGTLPELAQLNAWALDAQLALPDGKPLRFGDGAPGGALSRMTVWCTSGVGTGTT